MENDKDIQVFVLTYPKVRKKDIHEVFDKDYFTFVLCGAECGCTPDYNFIPDNKGENLSKYNELINENTGTFFVGSHLDELNHKNYIGFMQYSKFMQVDSTILKERTIAGAFLRNGLTVLQKFKILNLVYFDEFLKEFSAMLMKANSMYFSNERTSFKTYLLQKESIHFNMFAVHIDTFRKWFDVMRDGFGVITRMIDENMHNGFSDLEDRMKRENMEISEKTLFGNKRIYAFLMEIFSSYAFFFISNGWSNEYTYIPCRFFGFDINKKNIHPV